MKITIDIIIFCLIIPNLIISLKLKQKFFQGYKGDAINENEKLESKNGNYYAVLKTDGNFEVISVKGKNGRNEDFPLWTSTSNKDNKGKGPFKVIMQLDGNAVLYDSFNKPNWASDTFNLGKAPYRLIMQDDGNLVIYDSHDKATWATNTYGKK